MEKFIKPAEEKELGAFETQAISQADDLQPKTDVALPSDENVEQARDWVIENKK